MTRARGTTIAGLASLPLAALSLLAAVLTPAPLAAQPVDGLQVADSAVQSVGWKLALANRRYCARTAPETGIMLADLATYDDARATRTAYGLGTSGEIFVGALADEAPGARAGLVVNTMVRSIGNRVMANEMPPPRQDWFARVQRLQNLIDTTAAREGHVDFGLYGGKTVTVVPEITCHVRFFLDDGKTDAHAVRDEVHIGHRYVDQLGGDTDLLAALVAHEMAHAVLDHETELEAAHGRIDVTRRTEREADRLSVWLMANAGYDPENAVRLQQEVIRRRGSFLAFDPTHGSWRSRAETISAEIEALHAAPDADWPHRFVREKRDN